MKKRILAIVLTLCLLAVLPVPALAAQETEMICWTQAEPGKLSMLLACQTEEGNYSASLDGKELTLTGGTVAEEKLPVTIYCLVDTSGSISKFKMKLIRNTLKTISKSMSGGDNMILATVDNTVKESQPLSTAEDREAAIDAIASSNKYTNLYSGIVTGLDRLASATDLNPVRALVVLSDGLDRQDNGMTEQEVSSAIAKTRLPIFTVALIEGYSERSGGKVLGSFARSSCGGMHLTTVSEGSSGKVNWDASGEAFGQAIWQAVSGGQYLTAELDSNSLDTTKAELQLTVSYTTANSSHTDSVTVSTSSVAVPAEETIEETTVETTEPEPEVQESSLSYIWVIAAVVVLAVLAAVVLVMRNKKKKEEEARRLAEEKARQEADAAAAAELGTTTPVDVEPPVTEPAEPADPELLKQHCTVELVDIPHGEHPCGFSVPMDEQVSFGRNSKSRFIIDREDSKLSGCHFSLVINKNLICVRDEHSTNGTFLNGIRIADSSWTKLESGDKLRAGSREYRLTVKDQP